MDTKTKGYENQCQRRAKVTEQEFYEMMWRLQSEETKWTLVRTSHWACQIHARKRSIFPAAAVTTHSAAAAAAAAAEAQPPTTAAAAAATAKFSGVQNFLSQIKKNCRTL